MMNVLIVDDERNIREGIKALIDWQAHDCQVVGECSNGKLALDYMADTDVDILVTDIKMPVMDGLELSARVKDDFPNTKVVILTAYSEFEMARTAIKNEVADFIIKNEFMTELPTTIERCVQSIQDRRDQMAGENAISDDEYFFSIVKSLALSGEIDTEQVIKSGLHNYNYCICACNINQYDQRNGDRDMLEVLKHMMEISFGECRHTIWKQTEHSYLIGICYEKKSVVNLQTVVNYFSNILIMIEEFMRIDIKLGLSSEITDATMLRSGYREAVETLAKMDGEGCELNIYDRELFSGTGDFLDINWYADKIAEETFDEKRDDSGRLMKDFTDKLKACRCSFEQCKLYMLVIFSSLIHRAVRYQLNTELDFNEYEKKIYRQVQEAMTIKDLQRIGTGIIGELRELCIGKRNMKNELVDKVDGCIREHYSEELTLQVISNMLFLNNSYISRTYKKMTGYTVTEAITSYRVGKAKELLANTNKKIYQIAQDVGFNDPAYFTNVFFKFAGVSPSDYRLQNS